MKIRRALLILVFATALPTVQAQTGNWPNKPVRIVVPYPTGGPADLMARVLAPRLMEEYGQQFVVDNRVGAGGTIGSAIVAHANPDGHTIIVVPSSYATNAVVYKLSYDPVKGIAPIGEIMTGPFILVVNPTLNATGLKEFIELARAKPGTLNVGSSGTGSMLHFAAALFQQMSKTEMVHVPYKGDSLARVDLLAGQIQVMFSGPLTVSPQIRAGKLRALAVTTEKRWPSTPDLPAISERVPGYSLEGWFGMWAPAGTPREIVSRLNQSIARTLNQPDVQAWLHRDSMEPAHSTPEEFARIISQDIAKWSKVVKVGNIRID